MTSDISLAPDAKRPRLDGGPSLDASDALAKLRAAAQAAIDSVTMSMLAGASDGATAPAQPKAPVLAKAAPPAAAPSAAGPPAVAPSLAASLDALGAATMAASAPSKLPIPMPTMPSTSSTASVASTNSFGPAASFHPGAGAQFPPAPAAAGATVIPVRPQHGDLSAAGLSHGGSLPSFLGSAALAGPCGLPELGAQPKAPVMPPSSLQPEQELQARVQAMAAGKLSAIEAVAGIQAPPDPGSRASPPVPMPTLPQLDSLAGAAAGDAQFAHSPALPSAAGSPPASTLTAPAPAESGESQAAAQMYMLAQLAEESAQTAASAAACLNGAESDPSQVAAIAEAAQQAAARASWASSTLATCFPEPFPGQPPEDDWTTSLRTVTFQASEAAEQAAINCRLQATDLVNKMSGQTAKSKVPCKWFLLGQCRKTICEFSHDIQDLQPRPLHKKRAEECHYFQKGQCTRGTACPFAHGPEELAEITRIVSDLKTEKRFIRR